MRPIKAKWQEQKLGLLVGPTEESRLTSLRFADDVLLVARSKKHLTQMLRDVCESVSQYGLELHPGKTKVLSNTTKCTGRGANTQLSVNGLAIQIVPLTADVKYLGRRITFDNAMRTELDHRIRCAWAKFVSFKQELTGKYYSLRDRLKLFDSVVTPAVLYGSTSWTLTKVSEHLLIRTQRRMLRMILGSGRRRVAPVVDEASSSDVNRQCGHPDVDNLVKEADDLEDGLESWRDWIQRTTHQVEEHLDTLNIESWLHQARRRKWAWAARVVNLPEDRWANRLMKWNPQLHIEGLVSRRGRRQARPRARWEDELVAFVRNIVPSGDHWTTLAMDERRWSDLADAFVEDAWRTQSHAIRAAV